jgi:hypothetical protein
MKAKEFEQKVAEVTKGQAKLRGAPLATGLKRVGSAGRLSPAPTTEQKKVKKFEQKVAEVTKG